MGDAIGVKTVSQRRRYKKFQCVMGLVRTLVYMPPQTLCDPVHVNVNRQHLSPKRVHQHAFGYFGRNARKQNEIVVGVAITPIPQRF